LRFGSSFLFLTYKAEPTLKTRKEK